MLGDISLSVILPVLALELILLIVALVSCVKQERTNGPKWMWILIILFASIVGPVAYFIFGRRND